MPELGISEQDIQTLVSEVSIVFHSAATVKFDEALKTSIEFNVLGTRRVINLCHKMPLLKVRSITTFEIKTLIMMKRLTFNFFRL